ncbi:hypothetical protein GCM10027429_22480 [Marivirga atlantica]|uniref:HYR domain-containing protein n=1 Tax=Marivirga atlantica TaxID=1548457 RepID=A0A937ABH0_9BACT|nr:HYR domain-containing protein [Marivirga atlantica]MBL0765866.1 HYR domain-containing protein [Marivirga atlantica]
MNWGKYLVKNFQSKLPLVIGLILILSPDGICAVELNKTKQAPTVSNCPSDITTQIVDDCAVAVSWTEPTADDDILGIPLTPDSNFSPGDQFPVGTTTVTYTFTNILGQESTCSFDVTVKYQFFDLPSDITITAGTSCNTAVAWVPPNNCGVMLSSTYQVGDDFPIGTTDVTYVAIRGASVDDIASFSVTVNDNIDPVLSGCPASDKVIQADANCKAVLTDWPTVTATDNCTSGLVPTADYAEDFEFSLGTTTVTYSVLDEAGNEATCSFDVTVVDNTGPVFTNLPGNITVAANANNCKRMVSWPTVTAVDNCGGTVTVDKTHAPNFNFDLGVNSVIYTAIDARGNETIGSFNVTVEDQTPPTVSGCPTNISLDANGNCEATATWTNPTFDDKCSAFTVSSNYSSGDTFPLGTTVVNITATDSEGNQTTCSFNVTVSDVTNPVFTLCPPSIQISANANCEAVVNWDVPTVTDNCDGSITPTANFDSGDTFPLGTTTVNYVATDAAGNSAFCSFSVTVNDNSAPEFESDLTTINLAADASCNAIANWSAPVITDNCSSNITIDQDFNSGDQFPIGSTTVTYTATDEAGNQSSFNFEVLVTDQTNPVFSNCPDDIMLNADENCLATANWTAPTVSDNCTSNVSLSSSHSSGDDFSVGTTTITYTAKDEAGNIATCSFNVIVKDETLPQIVSCPNDITLASSSSSCTVTASWTPPVFTDNCDATLTVESSHAPGDAFQAGTTEVVYTATDDSGNEISCSFNVTVNDETAPVFTNCLADLEAVAADNCEAIVTWNTPLVTDNCGETVDLIPSIESGSSFPIGLTEVVYTATDASGNSSTCSFNVRVTDGVAPTLVNCVADIEIAANNDCQAVVSWENPTFEDCSSFTLTSDFASGSTFNLGVTEVTYTAEDDFGNTSSCSFNVTVIDESSPEITSCPEDIVLTLPAFSCAATATWSTPTFTDNCDNNLTIEKTHSSGQSFERGTTQVTYAATDDAGNTSTCSFNVIVQDVTAPTFTNCPSDIQVVADNNCEASANWSVPVAADNCDEQIQIVSSHAPGNKFPLGITEVTYTATDLSGNSTTCTFSVIVEDEDEPVLVSCVEDIVVGADDNCQAVVSWESPVFNDCSELEITSDIASGSIFELGETVVTYTATDTAGYDASCSFIVNVVDQTAPSISSCPEDILVKVDDTCESVVNWNEPELSDNCANDNIIINSNFKSGNIFSVGTTEVIYTFTDDAGNESSCSFKVKVENNQMPEIINCPNDITVETDDSGSAIVEWQEPEVNSFCSVFQAQKSHEPGDTFNEGSTTVTYVFTDSLGNELSCSFVVDVSIRDIEFEVSKLVTPNGDGNNDLWIVSDLQNFPNNEVVIVDRWGGQIFKAKAYDNEQVVWDGTNQNGEVVPTGTYFYYITVKSNSVTQTKKGFIEVIR